MKEKHMCSVNILHLIEGAKQAKGLTVFIDVFRAFSLECYLYDMEVKQIRPVGTIEEAFSLRHRIQNRFPFVIAIEKDEIGFATKFARGSKETVIYSALQNAKKFDVSVKNTESIAA